MRTFQEEPDGFPEHAFVEAGQAKLKLGKIAEMLNRFYASSIFLPEDILAQIRELVGAA